MIEIKYVGPEGTTSDRYGVLERGRVYQEADDQFATYLVAQHPDHWQLAEKAAPAQARVTKE